MMNNPTLKNCKGFFNVGFFHLSIKPSCRKTNSSDVTEDAPDVIDL